MSVLNNGNIVVLVDQFTRRAVETITYDALSKHTSVIVDIREVDSSYYGCDVVFFEPAVPSIVTPEILKTVSELHGIKPHLIYSTDEVGFLFSGIANCVKANYKMLEWNLVYAVVSGDNAILEPYLRNINERLDFSDLLGSIPEDSKEAVDRVYTSYLKLSRDMNSLVSSNARLNEIVQNYRSVGKKTAKAIEELRSVLNEAVEENRTYCAMLSENYDVTFSGMYTDRPRVLYIKTVSHLSGIDNLIMVLYAVLTKQYKVSCKVVKIVDSTNAIGLRYVPNVYIPITDNYNTSEVLLSDFVMVLGAYNVLLSLLMLNRSGLDFLIIHDTRGTSGYAMDDSLIDLKLHEMSGDYAILGEYENTISDIEGSSQFHWDFKDIAEHAGSKISKLSNHPTIAAILDYIM